MTSSSQIVSQTITTDEGSLTLSGVELIEASPEGAATARQLIDAAVATGITSMKARRIGRYMIAIVRGRALTPMAKIEDGALSLGAGRAGLYIRRL